MPRVPVYGPPKVQQSTGPQNLGQITTRANANTFGSGDISGIVDASTKLFQQAKANADQVAVLEAETKLTALETDLLYSKERGAFNKRGKDAFSSVESVNSELETNFSEIEKNLSNDSQKRVIRERYNQRKEQVNRQLNQHVSSEIRKYDSEVTESFLANNMNLAVANPYNEENRQNIHATNTAKLMEHAQRNGLPDEWLKQKIAETTSKTNMAVMNKMLSSGDDSSAEKFFASNKEMFFGEDRIRAEKMAQEGSLLGVSMRAADEIFQQGGGITQMMAKTRDMEPRKRQATEQRIQHLNQQKKLAENDYQERGMKSALNAIDSGGSTWQEFAKTNQNLWSGLGASERNTIMNYRKGGAAQTDPQIYYQLRMAAANSPGKFKEENLLGYVNQLAPADFQEIVGIQTKMSEGKTAGLDGFLADNAIVDIALKQANYSTKKDDDDAIKFRVKVDQALIAHQASTGKKANNDDVRKIVSDLMVEEKVEAGEFRKYAQTLPVVGLFVKDPTKRRFEMSEDQAREAKLRKDRPVTVEELKSRGKAVTEENIQKFFNQVNTAGRGF